jgi:hypothetical protein
MERIYKKGTKVVLTEEGKACWERNKHYKKINPNKIMEIEQHKGFDSGRDIYVVKCGNNKDYYFDYCITPLTEVEIECSTKLN